MRNSPKQYAAHRAERNLPTLPPPASLPTDLRAQATRIRDLASRMLAQANDLEHAADRIDPPRDHNCEQCEKSTWGCGAHYPVNPPRDIDQATFDARLAEINNDPENDHG